MRILELEKKKIGLLALVFAFLFCLLNPMKVQATEEDGAAYLIGTANQVELSPQGKVVTMTVYTKNFQGEPNIMAAVADPSVCSVSSQYNAGYSSSKVTFTRGETIGQTTVTLYEASHPDAKWEVTVNNAIVAQSFAYEGDGNQDIIALNLPKFPYKVTFTQDAPAGFCGVTYTTVSGESGVLFNEVGTYTGSTILEHGLSAATVQIMAGGHWTLTFEPVVYTGTGRITGTGDRISDRFTGDDKAHSINCINLANKGNYIVWLIDLSNNKKTLLCNAVATANKTKTNVFLSKWSTYVISVQSKGTWSIDLGDSTPVSVIE